MDWMVLTPADYAHQAAANDANGQDVDMTTPTNYINSSTSTFRAVSDAVTQTEPPSFTTTSLASLGGFASQQRQAPTRSMSMSYLPAEGTSALDALYDSYVAMKAAEQAGNPMDVTRAAWGVDAGTQCSEPLSSNNSDTEKTKKDRRRGGKRQAKKDRRKAEQSANNGGIKKSNAEKRSERMCNARLAKALEDFAFEDDDVIEAGSSAQQQQQPAEKNGPVLLQHPLRRVLRSLPGFSYGPELDAVRFRNVNVVLAGVAALAPADGSGDLREAKRWLARFLLLAFRTRADFLRMNPESGGDVDKVQGGYAVIGMQVREVVLKYHFGHGLRPRHAPWKSGPVEKMEVRCTNGTELRKIVHWTVEARRRFLEEVQQGRAAAMVVPGYGAFGGQQQVGAGEEPSLSEKLLWEMIDAMDTSEVTKGFEDVASEDMAVDELTL